MPAMSSSRLECVQNGEGLLRMIGAPSSSPSSPPPFHVDDYDPENTTWDYVNVLVVGAGGIGCELLHLLALSGFGEITIIDLDTIELSNLNRQFLFREEDIGSPKSQVAARRVMERCPGVVVHSVFGRIEDQSDAFYRNFDAIVMGLDSVAARLWMNNKVAELATREIVPVRRICASAGNDSDNNKGGGGGGGDGDDEEAVVYEQRIQQAIPIIDTGTEGLKGHVRVIDMASNRTCIQCQMWMYGPARKTVPMCTLENIPRIPEHCVLYVQFKEWVDAHGEGDELDADNVEHIRWVTERAQQRQKRFNIGGPPITDTFTLGVVKNVVPAVSFTNAMVAGMAVTELMKRVTGVAPSLDNYYLMDGNVNSAKTDIPNSQSIDGCSTCDVCGPKPVVTVNAARTTVIDLYQAIGRAAGAATAPMTGTLSLLFLDGYGDGDDGHAQREVVLVREGACVHGGAADSLPLRNILPAAGAADLLRQWSAATHESEQPPVTALLIVPEAGGRSYTVAIRCSLNDTQPPPVAS